MIYIPPFLYDYTGCSLSLSLSLSSQRCWTPLHFAADRGHKDAVELLAKNGAQVTIVLSLLSFTHKSFVLKLNPL